MDRRQQPNPSGYGFQSPHPLYQYFPLQYQQPLYQYSQWQYAPFAHGYGHSARPQSQLSSTQASVLPVLYGQPPSSLPLQREALVSSHATTRAQLNQSRPLPVVQPGEDLISLGDSPISPPQDSGTAQQAQPSLVLHNVTNQSPATMQQATPSFPGTTRQEDDIQHRIDEIVHRSMVGPQQYNNATQSQQDPGSLQTGASPHPPVLLLAARASNHDSETPVRPLLFRQAAAICGNQNLDILTFKNHRTSHMAESLPQTGIAGQGKSLFSTVTANIPAQNSYEKENIVPEKKASEVSDERHNTQVVPMLVSLSGRSPLSDGCVDISLAKVNTDHEPQDQSSQVVVEHFTPSSSNRSSAFNTASSKSCSSDQLLSASPKSGHSPISSASRGRNRTRGKSSQRGSRKQNNPPNSNTQQSAARKTRLRHPAMGPNPRRVVRTTMYSTEAGEIMQESVGADLNSKAMSPIKSQVLSSSSPSASETQSAKLESSSSNRSSQDTDQSKSMPTTERRVFKNSTGPLLSVDELFSNVGPAINQPAVSPPPSAINDGRPPTLQELRALRDAAVSSTSVMLLRSPSPVKKVGPQIAPFLGTSTVISTQNSGTNTGNVSRPTSSKAEETIEKIRKVCAETSRLRALPEATIKAEPSTASSAGTDNETGDSKASDHVETKSTDGIEIFVCTYCPDEYCSIEAKLRHEAVCRRRTAWPKKCCFCGTVLQDRQALLVHADPCSKTYKGRLHEPALAKSIRLKMSLRANKKGGPNTQTPAGSSNINAAAITTGQGPTQSAARSGTAVNVANASRNNTGRGRDRARGNPSAATDTNPSANRTGRRSRRGPPPK